MATIDGTPNDDYLEGGSDDDVIHGGGGNDVVFTYAGDDQLFGDAGNDYLVAGDGEDALWGGDGNDEAFGHDGDDLIRGEAGDDKLKGHLGADDIQGGDGNDSIEGDFGANSFSGDGADTLDGGAGNDLIRGGGGNDIITGGADFDQLYGDGGSDFIDGGDGDDYVIGRDGGGGIDSDADVLLGGAGNDNLIAGYGDRVDGGSGTDIVYLYFYGGAAGITADLRQLANGGTMTIGGAEITNIEYVGSISLTEFDDHVIAGPIPSGVNGVDLSGWGGNDELTGTAAVDTIHGGEGDDVIYGGGGRDPGTVPSGDRLSGEGGNDVIHGGADGIEASGGTGDDLIYGGDRGDDLHGDGGNDVLYGGGGFDGLVGWSGDDIVVGGDGADYMWGMEGIDTVDYSQESGGQDVFVNLRFTEIAGPGPGGFMGSEKARDTYGNVEDVREIEDVITGAGNDKVYGSLGVNRLETGAGNDLLHGGGGKDILIGGSGDDLYQFDIGFGAFEATIVELAGGGTDEVRTSLASFSLAGIAEVENLTGTRSQGASLTGNGLANRITGAAGADMLDGAGGNDFLFLQHGGDDSALGGEGNDVLYFGGALSAGDVADGGDGRDAMVLQGNVTAILSDSNLSSIESISLQSGANATFGDTANNFYDFDITTADGNVAAGQQLIVNGQSLRAGEDFSFDGSAETDGAFRVFGGHGVDILKGGAGVDVFFFEGQRWGPSDRVDGGGGRDSLVISAGSGLTHIEFAADSFTNIESISVNNFFATDPSQKPSYELVLHNGNVAPGDTLIVNGSSIPLGQVVGIDGRAVHDGNLRLFGGGGHDILLGGDGADTLIGGGGADGLRGGAGADTFRYDAASDSVTGLEDLIGDFQSGVDKIDLGRVDADTTTDGNQAFTWIGDAAFSGVAGQLRTYEQGGYQWVAGDTDGDSDADIVIAFQIGTPPLVQGDFLP